MGLFRSKVKKLSQTKTRYIINFSAHEFLETKTSKRKSRVMKPSHEVE